DRAVLLRALFRPERTAAGAGEHLQAPVPTDRRRRGVDGGPSPATVRADDRADQQRDRRHGDQRSGAPPAMTELRLRRTTRTTDDVDQAHPWESMIANRTDGRGWRVHYASRPHARPVGHRPDVRRGRLDRAAAA